MKINGNSICGTGNTITNGNNSSARKQNVRGTKYAARGEDLCVLKQIAHGRFLLFCVRCIIRDIRRNVKPLCISDPGEQIVKEAHARGIKVVPVPAASACVTALAASGQPTARFVFEGFLPVPKRERRERLDFLQKETRTMIFYEAPHKLRGTLDDLAVTFGTDRSVSLCRELTKLHEEIKKTTLGEAVAFYRENDPRGEYVLVLAGADPARLAEETAPTLEEAVAAARTLQAGGMPPSAAAKQAAAGTPFSKGQIYKELIK